MKENLTKGQLKEIKDQLVNIFDKIYTGNTTAESVKQLGEVLEQYSRQSEQEIQIYLYNLQQEATNFLVQRVTYRKQQKLREQLAGLQNPENHIIIQDNPPLPTPEEENEESEESEQEQQEQQEMAINNAQFNTLVNNLNQLATAIGNNQGRGEAKFAKIVDFYGDTQDPIRWLQDFENASRANNISDLRK